MATKAELQAQLDELNIEYDENATNKELAALLPSNDGEGSRYIVWLRTRAYINDTERVDAGVYAYDEVPERFRKLPRRSVVVYEGHLPTRELKEIARWAGVNPDEYSDDAELEAVIVSEPKPFTL